jgi:hypothetical protein
MLAVLRDLYLEKYTEKTVTSPIPGPGDPSKPVREDIEAMKKWKGGDARA